MPLADADLNAKDYGFKILRASLSDLDIVYDLTKSGYIEKISAHNLSKLNLFQIANLDLKEIFAELVGAKGSSFVIESLTAPVELFGLEKVKSSSQKKSDINLLVKSTSDSKEFQSGFSIKSKLGQPSTLLNASQATNFIFKLCNFQGNITKINSIENSKKIKERLKHLLQALKAFYLIRLLALSLKII